MTIACGACSGFHGLVCSGTTSKQIDRESHCRAVGYGAMLAEGFVALIALVTVMIVAPARRRRPGARHDLRQRHRRLPDAHHRRGEPAVRDHLRRDGVLDLRLRHARRLHPAGTLCSERSAAEMSGYGGAALLLIRHRRGPCAARLVPVRADRCGGASVAPAAGQEPHPLRALFALPSGVRAAGRPRMAGGGVAPGRHARALLSAASRRGRAPLERSRALAPPSPSS